MKRRLAAALTLALLLCALLAPQTALAGNEAFALSIENATWRQLTNGDYEFMPKLEEIPIQLSFSVNQEYGGDARVIFRINGVQAQEAEKINNKKVILPLDDVAEPGQSMDIAIYKSEQTTPQNLYKAFTIRCVERFSENATGAKPIEAVSVTHNEDTDASTQYLVKANTMNVYASPDIRSNILGTLIKDVPVDYKKTLGEWAQINFFGNTAYVKLFDIGVK